MRISDWNSDVCSSDLRGARRRRGAPHPFLDAPRLSAEACADLPRSRKRPARRRLSYQSVEDRDRIGRHRRQGISQRIAESPRLSARGTYRLHLRDDGRGMGLIGGLALLFGFFLLLRWSTRVRSEEHTSELQSLMRISYAV